MESPLTLLYEKQSPGATVSNLNAGVVEVHVGLTCRSSLPEAVWLAKNETVLPGSAKHSLSTLRAQAVVFHVHVGDAVEYEQAKTGEDEPKRWRHSAHTGVRRVEADWTVAHKAQSPLQCWLQSKAAKTHSYLDWADPFNGETATLAFDHVPRTHVDAQHSVRAP